MTRMRYLKCTSCGSFYAVSYTHLIPADLTALFDQFIKGKTIAKGVLAAAIIAAIILVTVVFVVILQDAVRKIPVQYSKKIQGRKQVGGQSTYIPLKVNTAGEMCIRDRYASSVIEKLLKSAIANAENNNGMSAENLYIAECYANKGPTMKRIRPRAQGRDVYKRQCKDALGK